MATPPFVPMRATVAPPRRNDFAGIPPARRTPLRPGAGRPHPRAPGFGLPCPDAGYALLLANVVEERLVLEPHERRHDAEFAIATIAMRRAGVLGRAPLIGDVELARVLLAYDSREPADFTRWRARRLAGVAHDPDLGQRLADVAILAAELDQPDDAAVWNWRACLRRSI